MRTLDTLTISTIVENYNNHNEWINGERNENYDPETKISTYQIFDKYNPSFEDCEKIDSKINTWDNEDVSLSTIFFLKNEDLNSKTIKNHSGDIIDSIYQLVSLCEYDDEAYDLYKKYNQYIDRDELIEYIRDNGIEYDDSTFESLFPEKI